MDQQRSLTFQQLKPLCILVTKEPSRQHVVRLQEELKSINVNSIQELQEYIIFPLRLVFKQVKAIQQDVYISVCECMEFVFTHTTINNWQMFQDLFTTFCLLISPPQETTIGVDLSEELILVVLKTLSVLVTNTEWSVLKTLYLPASLPALGHAVSLLLREAELEKSRSLQIAAITCLDILSQSQRKVGRSERLLLGDVFASFLPGIAMCLSRIITGDQKQGYAVIVKSLDTWCKVTCLVMADEMIQLADNKKIKNSSSIEVNDKINELIISRSDDWVTSTSSKLLILIKQITTIRTYSNWRVRMALVEWADLLLKKCYRSMKNCVSDLLDVLVGFIGDDYPNIRTKSLATLDQFKHRQSDVTETKALQEILAENLHSLTTSLPRQIRMADEDEKLSIVNLLNGYLTLLGSDINNVFKSMAHLRRLSLSLVQVLELDCSDIRIIEHKSTKIGISGLPSLADVVKPNKVFKHFRDDKIQGALFRTCHLLGCHGDLDLLVDHMLDVYRESSLYHLQAILILNEIISGTKQLQKGETELQENRVLPIIRMLIDEYLSDANFNLPTSNTGSAQHATTINKPDLTVANMNHNVMQICLLLEGIGKFSKVADNKFGLMMLDVVYPLLEKLGQDNTYVSHTAYLCLLDICTACNYRSVGELICSNSDYLVNAISLKLRHFYDGHRAPSVLQVMLQYSSCEILPLIHDTIQEILESLDDHYETQTALYLQVLRELVLSIIRWFPIKDTEQNGVNSQNSCSKSKTVETARQEKLTLNQIELFFIEYHNNKRLADGHIEHVSDDDNDVTEDAADHEEENVDNKKLPYHITAIKEILLRTKHLLSSKNPRHRLLVLDVIQSSVIALHSYSDELLPLLHETWMPFAFRFADEEKLVTVKATATLEIMSNYSGDFLMKRTVKDIIPLIKQFLFSQSKISHQSGSVYTYTVNYKLQLTYLQSLGPLSLKLNVQQSDLNLIVSCCLPYLSSHQPFSLQEACLSSFHHFIHLDCDIVWLFLSNLYSPIKLLPPSPLFQSVQIRKSVHDGNEYKDNVNILLPITMVKL